AHSDDYRTIRFNGTSYNLTTRQAQVVQILHDAYKNRTPGLGHANILERLGTSKSRLRDTFRKTGLWGTLIVKEPRRRGLIRLALPDSFAARTEPSRATGAARI